MSKIATIPVFSSIVAILFFLNCQRWDYTTLILICIARIYIFMNYFFLISIYIRKREVTIVTSYLLKYSSPITSLTSLSVAVAISLALSLPFFKILYISSISLSYSALLFLIGSSSA